MRPIISSDIQYLNEWKNKENIYKNLGGGYSPVSINQQEKWMDSIIDLTGNNRRYLICDLERNPVGLIGLYSINWIHRTSEIGLFIGEEKAMGKGYAKEACILLERYARDYLNLRKINLKVIHDNDSGLRLWTSLEYKEVGVYKKERFVDGAYRDLMIMEKFL